MCDIMILFLKIIVPLPIVQREEIVFFLVSITRDLTAYIAKQKKHSEFVCISPKRGKCSDPQSFLARSRLLFCKLHPSPSPPICNAPDNVVSCVPPASIFQPSTCSSNTVIKGAMHHDPRRHGPVSNL